MVSTKPVFTKIASEQSTKNSGKKLSLDHQPETEAIAKTGKHEPKLKAKSRRAAKVESESSAEDSGDAAVQVCTD